MRLFFVVLVMMASCRAIGQQTSGQGFDQSAKYELQKFWNELQLAAVTKDRKALEQFFADEFVIIHAGGAVDSKTDWINKIISSPDYRPAPLPSFDQLYVYGDVAVLRVNNERLRGSSIYAKRNGIWQLVQTQSTAIPPERKSISLDMKILDQYVGKYEQAPGVFTLVTRQGDTLMAKGMNRPAVAILPVSETRFFVKDNVGEFTFHKDQKGTVTHFILVANGRETKGVKVE